MNIKKKLTPALKVLFYIACFNVFFHQLAFSQTTPSSFTFEKIVATEDQLLGIPSGTPSLSEPSLNGSDLTFIGQKKGVHEVKAIYFARANSFNPLVDTNTPFPEETGVGFSDFNSVSSSANIIDNDSDGIPDDFDNDPDAIADGSCTEIDGVVGIAFVSYTGNEHCSASNWISTGFNVIVNDFSEVIYEAGDSIHLFPGFQVKKGGLFSAFISEESNPEIDPPLISAFTPSSGPVGTLVTLSGNNFAPEPGLVPEVLMRKQGGGTQRVPIAGYDNRQIRITVPTGTDSGSIKVQVGEQSRISAQNFTVQTSSDYQLQAEPATAQLIPGHSIVYSINLSSNNGFNQLATLQINGLPTGMLAEFTPQKIAAGQQSTLTVTAAPDQALGDYNLTVIADADIDGFPVTQTVNLTAEVIAETTSFMGQAVQANPQQTPLAGVNILFLGRDGNGNPTGCNAQTTSDAAGNFVFTNLPPECTGDQLIRYDGLSVSNLSGDYAGVDLYYNISDGIVTESPVLVHLPRIDDKETVMVKQNWPEDQHFTFASMPNMEATVYAGTILTLIDGSQPDPFPLIAVDVPVDRLPEEMPPGGTIEAFIVAFQPANAKASQPVAVTFPNLLNTAPGTQMSLSTLDPTKGVMVVYGTGTVSADGTKIIPGLDPANPGKRFGLVHFDWHGPVAPPPPENNLPVPPESPYGKKTDGSPDKGEGNTPGGCPGSCNPIDFATGLENITVTDMLLSSERGTVEIERIYRTLSNEVGPFGIGSSHRYGYRINDNTPFNATLLNLILPNGTRAPFIPNAGGVYINATMLGVTLTVAENNEADLRWKSGTIYHFIPGNGLLGSVLQSIADVNGNTITLVRAENNPAQIAEIIDPVDRKLRLSYDTNNRITSIIDPIGRKVSYTYNGSGALAAVTDPEGGVTRYEYQGATRLTKITDPRNNVQVINVYDANGRVVEQTLADGGKWKFDYSLLNTAVATSPVVATEVTDPLGNKTLFRFSTQGYVMDVTDATGQTRIFTRDPQSNQLLSITGSGNCRVCGNPAAGDVFYTYDAQGNLLTRTDAKGNSTRFTYEPQFNNIATQTDADNNTTTYQYDTAGNLTQIINAKDQKTQFVYDLHGQLVETINTQDDSLHISYDAFGNPIALTDALGNITRQRFDAVSRVTEIHDAQHQVTRLSYDKLNRIVSNTDAMGRQSQFSYDANSNRISVTDSRNHSVTFSYDAKNRLINRTDTLGNFASQVYDQNNNLIKLTDRRGQLSEFSYDILNRLIESRYIDGDTVNISYNPASLPVEINDTSGGSYYFDYDVLGRLLNTTGPNGAVDYAYDSRSFLQQRQVTGQAPVDYQYDPLGNLLSIDHDGHSINYRYDPLNRLTAQTRSNSVDSEYQYDPMGQLLSLLHVTNGTTLTQQRYTYDVLGNRSSHLSDTAQALTTQAENLTIDPLSNRLLQRDGISYRYDNNGNRLSATDANGETLYDWDARNRLQSIARAGGSRSEFRYNYAGDMIEQTDTVNGVSVSQSFVHDVFRNVVQQSDSQGRRLSVITGVGIDTHIATVDEQGKVFYGLRDGLNSTVMGVDENAAVVGRYAYEPFGETSVSGEDYPFKFTGRTQVGKDLYYYRARFYDPRAGRFISEDPIGFAGGDLNLGRYVGNNSVGFVDPEGLKKLLSQKIDRGMTLIDFIEGCGECLREGAKRSKRNRDKIDECLSNPEASGCDARRKKTRGPAMESAGDQVQGCTESLLSEFLPWL